MPREASEAGWIRCYPVTYQPEASDLTGTGALTLTTQTPGYRSIIEEFGFIVTTALVGGSQSYSITDGADNVIATIALTAGAGGKGTIIKTTVIADAWKEIRDPTQIKLKRIAGGTTVSAGTGEFYVKARQRPQQI